MTIKEQMIAELYASPAASQMDADREDDSIKDYDVESYIDWLDCTSQCTDQKDYWGDDFSILVDGEWVYFEEKDLPQYTPEFKDMTDDQKDHIMHIVKEEYAYYSAE